MDGWVDGWMDCVLSGGQFLRKCHSQDKPIREVDMISSQGEKKRKHRLKKALCRFNNSILSVFLLSPHSYLYLTPLSSLHSSPVLSSLCLELLLGILRRKWCRDRLTVHFIDDAARQKRQLCAPPTHGYGLSLIHI